MIKYDRVAKLEMLKSEAIACIEGTTSKDHFNKLFYELLEWINQIDKLNIPKVKTFVEDRGDSVTGFLLDSSEGNIFCLQVFTVPIEGRLGDIRVVTNDVEFSIVK